MEQAETTECSNCSSTNLGRFLLKGANLESTSSAPPNGNNSGLISVDSMLLALKKSMLNVIKSNVLGTFVHITRTLSL